MRGIRFLSFAVIIVFAFSFVAFAVSDEAKQHYDTAKSLYVAGDTDGAIAELEKALAIDPNYDQAKKLYEKLGGGKKKEASTSSTTASQPQAQAQSQQIQISGGSVMDREALKNNIALVLSNSVGQMRSEIFVLINDSVKESFDEMLKSGARNEVKTALKQAIFDVMKEVLKEEMNYSVGVIKEEVGVSTTSSNVSSKLDFDIKPKENIESSSPVSNSVSPSSSPTTDNKAKAKELYEKAIKLLDDENYSSARDLLIEANKLDPDNQDIQKALSRIPTK
jgi:tetratricopeptide (TPR) repeat protein